MISILKRDILLSVRSGTGFSLSLSFFLLMIIFVPLAIGPDDLLLKKIESINITTFSAVAFVSNN